MPAQIRPVVRRRDESGPSTQAEPGSDLRHWFSGNLEKPMTTENRAPEYDKDAPHQRPADHPVLSETEARQAVPTGHMRYVLVISLALVIIAFGIIYLAYFRGA